MNKFLLFLAVALLAAFLIAFVGLNVTGFFGLKQAQTQTVDETIKIGLLLPLTGDAALYGESTGTALELAREEINARGGILGKKVEFVVEDSKCDAKAGAQAINSLVSLKGLKLVIAAECSGPTLSAAPVAEKAKVLFLVAAATNPDIKYAGDYVFRIMPSDEQQGKDLAQLLSSRGYKRPAVLFMDNAYGEGIEKVFEKEFAKLGGNIAVKQMVKQADSDFRTPLLKIKEATPDALLIVGYPQMYQVAIKQFFELGLNMQIFATETFKDEETLRALGDKADGIIFAVLAESDSAAFKQFRESYKKRFGKEFGPYGDYSYDSLYVLKAGIEQANSFDPEVLKNSLYSLDYNGITGETKFDSFGEVDKPYGIMTVKDGKFVPYR